MPTTTTTVRSSSSGVAVHTISFRGLAGAIFVCLVFAAILYVIGFATTSWSHDDADHEGLWETCTCNVNKDTEDWFKAVQAMITIGLIGLLICMLLSCIYLCVHTVSKNSTIIALVILCFITVLFMLIGFCVYGAKTDGDLHWSFAITVVAAFFTLLAGILSIVQLRKSGVRV